MGHTATALADTDPGAGMGVGAGAGASVDPRVVAITQARTAENLAVHDQLEAIAGLYVAWQPDQERRRADRRRGRRDTSAWSLHEAEVVTETAAALAITEGAAARRVEAAVALHVTGRLPLTARLARRGRLDWRRIDTLVLKTRDLTPEDAAAVEAQVLVPAVLALTTGRFEDAVDRAVLAVDPNAADNRRKETARSRRVSLFKTRNGSDGLDAGATLWAEGPADALTAAYTTLDATARWYRAQGDPRTLDQLRHDLLVAACTTGHLDAPHHLVADTLADTLRAPDGTLPDAAHLASAHPANAHPASSTSPHATAMSTTTTTHAVTAPRPDIPVHLNVTVSLKTLLGHNDHPGTLDRYGPIPAQMIREMADTAIWRCVAVDDTHGTVLGVGTRTYTPGYVPGTNLKTFLTVAAPVCEVPWCNARAEHCDHDHRRPHAAGGATCSCNVGPACRRHHREKSAGDLTVRRSTDPHHPPGTSIWTTPGRQTFVQHPHTPLPPEAYTVRRTPPDAEPPTDGHAETPVEDDTPPF